MVYLLVWFMFTSLFFAALCIVLLVRHRKATSKIALQEASEKQKLYELSVLKQVQEKIGYSLDVEYITEAIIASLKHLFPYSTAASMVIKNNKIYIKTHVEQPVGTEFVKQVKQSMLTSLTSLLPSVPIQMEEQIVGSYLDPNNKVAVASFFNIPLTVGKQTVGLINVSSDSKDLYKETETTMLREIIDQASGALTKLQEVLVTEKEKLTSMIGSLADGVFMVDTDNNLLIINESAKVFLRIASRNTLYTEIISSFGMQYNIVEKIRVATETNKQIVDNELTFNDRTFKMFITPVRSHDVSTLNQTIGASVLMHDITIEKNITKIKEDFTHMIVHELRAPLTAIKDSSELMLEVFNGNGAMDKDQQEKLLVIIDKQSKNLLEQINQILDAAKIESGKFTINKIPSDIGQVIQDAVETFAPQAQKRQILLTPDIVTPIPKIEIDPVRINQVLTNLISNSIKFTPPGGKITISAKTEGEFMVVSVKDTGKGIPEDEQADLFSKYYQTKSAPSQVSKKGTGLGLFITKGIVEAHGGNVGIISKPNEGTNIFFKLPIKTMQTGQIVQEHLPSTGVTPVSTMVN